MSKVQKTEVKQEEPLFLYRLVKFLAHLYMMWPLAREKTLIDRLLEINCWIMMINGGILFIAIIGGTISFYQDIETFITLIFIIFELTLILEDCYTSFLFKYKKAEFKVLLDYFEKTLTNVNSPEEILFRQYIRDTIPLAVLVYSMHCMLAIGFIHLQLNKPTLILPKELWYPIPLEPFKRKLLELTQQGIYIFHSGVLHIADGILFMSMHIARAKLTVLSDEFQHVINDLQLRRCIQVHQEIIWFVDLINSTSRYIVLKTTLAVFFYLTMGLFQLLHQKEEVDSLLFHQFFLIIIVANYRLYFGTQCADALALVGDNLRFSIPWAEQSLKTSKSMYIVIHRCQKPLIISVTGIIAQYSSYFYGGFLYKTFSYFLTLKAVLGL